MVEGYLKSEFTHDRMSSRRDVCLADAIAPSDRSREVAPFENAERRDILQVRDGA